MYSVAKGGSRYGGTPKLIPLLHTRVRLFRFPAAAAEVPIRPCLGRGVQPDGRRHAVVADAREDATRLPLAGFKHYPDATQSPEGHCMRIALIVGFIVAGSLVLFGYVAWNVFGFEETREYESYQAAAADNLFAGGWLPDFIPGSATRIVVTNDYDVNISRGEFRHDPADTAAFLARLRPWEAGDAPFNDFAARVAAMERRGYRAWEFAAAGNVWVFLVNAENGHVEYEMWRRSTRQAESAAGPP